MDEYEFQQLIDRYQRGECTPKEKQQIETWLNLLENQPGRFQEWEEHRQHQVGKHMLSSLLQRIQSRKNSPFRGINFAPLVKVAASLLIVFGLGYFIYRSLPGLDSAANDYTSLTSTSGISKHILSDGTIVWLKGKSKLSFPADFSGLQREVQLEGEALFEVAKDSSHPFLIHCGTLLTKVVGTSFNIKSTINQQQVEVVVFTGKVKLSYEAGKQEIMLLPYQKAIYQKATQVLTKTTEKQLGRYHQGTQYDMQFEDTPLSVVIERIEQKFNIRIELQDQRVKHCLVSADLTDQSLDIALKLISQALNGEYQLQSKKILLTIPGCS